MRPIPYSTLMMAEALLTGRPMMPIDSYLVSKNWIKFFSSDISDVSKSSAAEQATRTLGKYNNCSRFGHVNADNTPC